MAKKYIDAEPLKNEIKRIMSRAMNNEGQDVCNYILSIIDSSQKYSLPEWEEHPEATNNIAMVWNAAATPWLDWRGHRISVRSLEKLPGFDSLQQEQPCDTCTNDKGCVTCKDGELWEGKEQTLTDCNELQEPEVDLEKEVEKYFQGLWPGMETAEQCNTDMHFTPPAIMRLARHFYILGLKNNIPVTQITLDELAKKGEPVSEDLEAEIGKVFFSRRFEDEHGRFSIQLSLEEFSDIAKHFAEWQKSQMLKDAVEGVMIDSLKVQIMAPLNAVIQREGLKDGDKMKILIVKEDEK